MRCVYGSLCMRANFDWSVAMAMVVLDNVCHEEGWRERKRKREREEKRGRLEETVRNQKGSYLRQECV